MEILLAGIVLVAVCAGALAVLATGGAKRLAPVEPPRYDPVEFPYSLAMLARVHHKTAGRFAPEEADAPRA